MLKQSLRHQFVKWRDHTHGKKQKRKGTNEEWIGCKIKIERNCSPKTQNIHLSYGHLIKHEVKFQE